MKDMASYLGKKKNYFLCHWLNSSKEIQLPTCSLFIHSAVLESNTMPSQSRSVQLPVRHSLAALHNLLNLLPSWTTRQQKFKGMKDFQPCKLGFFIWPRVCPESTLDILKNFWALRFYPSLCWKGHSCCLNPCSSSSCWALRMLLGFLQNKTLFSCCTVWYQKLPQ